MNYNITQLKEIYKNKTFIDIPQEIIDYLYNYFNLDKEKIKIYISINDTISKDSKKATSEYKYQIFLSNLTILDLSSIEKDIYADVYVPIKDLGLAKYNYSLYFSDQGYDIYDKNDEFYTDFCTPA